MAFYSAWENQYQKFPVRSSKLGVSHISIFEHNYIIMTLAGEGHCYWRFENENIYRISKFMNCNLLQNSFLCLATPICAGEASVDINQYQYQ